LEFVCGAYYERTGGPAETVAWVVALYKWFQKEFSKHQSHKQIYAPEPDRKNGRRGSFTFPKIGPVELVAAQLPGVNKKAWEFGKKFKSVEALVAASEKELSELDGIGKKGAKKIYNWLRGEV